MAESQWIKEDSLIPAESFIRCSGGKKRMFLRQVKHTPQGGGKTVDNLPTSENWGDFMVLIRRKRVISPAAAMLEFATSSTSRNTRCFSESKGN
ncbi:hypothetical protein [Rhodoferax sp.]|uniref:hypothetical protein n=1 Tax=Rhodoferax sp. TaxID=50421 RepID=UPI003BB6FEF8